MREFRILGPLEVLLDGRVVPLGGQRQRSLLAVLLVHHGQVVPTERLVDLLWGEHAPRTATTSLQNGISQLRRELGADVVETRPPGYVLGVDREAIDAVRFETMLAAARSAPAAERAELLRAALALCRGPPLADLAGEEFAQGEIRRLEDLRLCALEERIAADLELGLEREVTGELEALSAANPLRERICALRMLALYRSGRQAEALQAFRDARRAFVEQLGLEPGAELQDLHARILRQEAGLGAGRASPPTEDVESEILRSLLAGKVVPVLGLAGGAELARRLAGTFDVPDDVPPALSGISQYVAAMQGAGPLHDELHVLYREAVEPRPVHRLLARLPAVLRERGVVRTRSSSRPRSTTVSSGHSPRWERSSTSSPTSPEARSTDALSIARPVRRPARWTSRTPTPTSPRTGARCCSGSVAPPTRAPRARGRASSSPRTTTSSIPGRASSRGRSR